MILCISKLIESGSVVSVKQQIYEEKKNSWLNICPLNIEVQKLPVSLTNVGKTIKCIS